MTRILLFALQNLSGSVIVRVLDDDPLSKEYEPSGASLRIFGDFPLIVIFFKVRLSALDRTDLSIDEKFTLDFLNKPDFEITP